ncbi:MAG: DUF669 domain-containing protein [Planctomycetota bacterium]|jgi:hypothetical protein|nr:DUF669 domain-containing protein [Planctomycetota bacterium]
MPYLDGFDANLVEPNAVLDPIPAGTYLVAIETSERKKNKNNSNEHLELVFKVLDGPHKGRTVRSRLNIWTDSAAAKRIAQGELSSICRAVGVMAPKNSEKIHNLPLEIAVSVTNPDENGRQYNEVRGYAKRGALGAQNRPNSPPPAPPQPMPTQPAPQRPAAPPDNMGWLQ